MDDGAVSSSKNAVDDGIVECESSLEEQHKQISQTPPPKARRNRFTRWLHYLEWNGVEPVPEEQQTQRSIWKIALIWLSVNINILSFSTGTLPPLEGMGLRSSFYTIVGFILPSSIVPAYFCTFGPRLGMRQMIHARYSFGYFGSSIIALAIVFSGLCYTILNAILAGETLQAASPWHGDHYALSSVVGIVIITVIAFLISICGIRVLHFIERYLWIPIVISFAILAGEAKASAQGLHTVHHEPKPATRQILGMGVLFVGFQLSYAGMASDVSLYLHRCASSTKLFIACLITFALPSCCIIMLGAAFGASAQTIPEWNELLLSNPSPGPLINYVLTSHLGNFGNFLTVLLAFSAIGNMALSFYFISVDFQIILPLLAKLPRFCMPLIAFSITLPVAIVGRNTFYDTLSNLASIIAYWTALYCGVVLADHIVIRRLQFSSYDPAIYNQWQKLPPGMAALGACILSLGLVIPFIDQTWFEGPLASALGDLGFEIGIVLSFVLYLLLRPLEMYIFKR
ncbi:hypothetical protein MVES_001460 [Malassezia vespertilionis]|uniref:Uncharacterized protein n=1 Tax=Malassezia vespertilionis TaxID=2020962 RepID=A0A2N1JCV7_9BASI|nr:hypothetical protein MVES_001460 [Malassezia vespertilionis]